MALGKRERPLEPPAIRGNGNDEYLLKLSLKTREMTWSHCVAHGKQARPPELPPKATNQRKQK